MDFGPNRIPGVLSLVEMEFELTGMLCGIKVDLRTPDGLSRHFREEVLSHAVLQYAH